MPHEVYQISYLRLLVGFLPILAVVIIAWRWKLPIKTYLYVTGRMLLQLFLVGFVLLYVFKSKNPFLVFAVVVVMFSAAGWIALHPIKEKRRKNYWKAFMALVIGGGSPLLLILLGVIDLIPWAEPRYFIPLAGMVFANSMNGVSLAAERFEAEGHQKVPYDQARAISLKTALLPITNSFLAAGLVTIPGIMTGQILAGVSPLLAARYQIMVLSMVFGGIGLSSALYLTFLKPEP